MPTAPTLSQLAAAADAELAYLGRLKQSRADSVWTAQVCLERGEKGGDLYRDAVANIKCWAAAIRKQRPIAEAAAAAHDHELALVEGDL